MDRNPRPPHRPAGVTVVGTGVVGTPVDRVTIMLAVDITRPDAGEAFRIAADTVTGLLALLADDGVATRQVRTLDLSVGPRTHWQDNQEVLIGYQAQQRLLVQLDGLAGVDRILSDVAMSGAGVRIESVSLTAAAADAAFEQARELAFADAWNKAEHFARLAAKTLGDVQWIQEGVDHGGPVPLAVGFGRKAMAAEVSMPVAGGDTDVSVSVTVRWAFADDETPAG